MSRERRAAWTLMGALLLGFILGGATVRAFDSDTPPQSITFCTEEDGGGSQELPCLWDGSKRGNGQGQSFIINQDSTITYL